MHSAYSVYVQIRCIISTYMYKQIPSAYSQYTDSFRVFSEIPFEDLTYSAYSPYLPTDSFCAFSVYEQIYSVYSQYMYRFIPSNSANMPK